MATFDFIESFDLRRSLERDSEELVECMKAGAWKAVYVLAGCIIYGTLIDHLRSSGKAADSELRDLTFGELLESCRERGIVSGQTIDLSSYILPQLNQIRPGLSVPTQDAADENGARMAQALVEIVVNEVAGHRRGDSSRAAEQIAARLSADPAAFRAADLLRLEEPERTAAKESYLRSLSRDPSPGVFEAASGLGVFLTSERDARAFFVPLAAALVDARDEETKQSLRRRFREEHALTSPDNRRVVRGWIQRVKHSLQRETKRAALESIEALETDLGRSS
jgi:hypothetical protein